MLAAFFHGVHATSFFDVALVFSLVMVAYSFFNQIYMMNLFLAEYVVIMAIQFTLAAHGNGVVFDKLNSSRVVLHMAIVALIYSCCIKLVNDRAETEDARRQKDEQIEAYDADMETKSREGEESQSVPEEMKEWAAQDSPDKIQETEWYRQIEGIDAETALQNSGSEAVLKDVMKIFYDAVAAKYETVRMKLSN